MKNNVNMNTALGTLDSALLTSYYKSTRTIVLLIINIYTILQTQNHKKKKRVAVLEKL